MLVAQLLAGVLIAYTAVGALFAIVFVTKGIGRVDPVAQTSKIGFRLIVFPGVTALWPLLFARWIHEEARTTAPERPVRLRRGVQRPPSGLCG